MKPKVFITRPVQQLAIDRIAERCDVRVHPEDEAIDPQQLIENIRDVDAVMPIGVRISAEVIAAASKLRIVANVGAGYDNVDVEACTRRGILVTNTPDVVTEATADMAFALMLSTARRVVEGDRYVRDGSWKRWQWNLLWGLQIHGKTLGLYGFGRIARAVARRSLGFSMRILYHARHRAYAHVEKELGAELVDRETLLRESDFISVHVPLTPDTLHSIGAPQFALMKPTSVVINTARGKVIDEEALAEALRSHRIAGAGLDVFENEPKVHPSLLALSNVVLVPHIGTATSETRLQMALRTVDNLLAALDGKRPPDLLNPEVLEQRS
jgi:lactate dehydrogenase-like 2-hydroxyacid dehydrogenase